MLMGRSRQGEEQGVAARPVAGQAGGFFGDFVWRWPTLAGGVRKRGRSAVVMVGPQVFWVEVTSSRLRLRRCRRRLR